MNYKSQQKAGKKELEIAAAANATLLAEVKSIKEGIYDVRGHVKELSDHQHKYGERLATVEAKVDRENVRIDRIEERINREG